LAAWAATTNNVPVSSRDSRSEASALWSRLEASKVDIDKARAELFVATVRPTQTATQVVRAWHRARNEGVADVDAAVNDVRRLYNEKEGGRVVVEPAAGEGATESPTGASHDGGQRDNDRNCDMSGGPATIVSPCESTRRGGLGSEITESDEFEWGIKSLRREAKMAAKEAKRWRAARAAERRASVDGSATESGQAVRVAKAGEVGEMRLNDSQAARATREKGGESNVRNGTARVRLVQREQLQSSAGELGPDVGSELRTRLGLVVEADDGLPTAMMTVDDEQRFVKLDSCARFTIAGTDWMAHGDKMKKQAPVELVEGIGGFTLAVLGVWSFVLRNIYGQSIAVEACIVEGCTSEFLLGVDFMARHRAMMDFETQEVRYDDGGRCIVIPFRTFTGEGQTRAAAARMAKRHKISTEIVAQVAMAVPAIDGELGLFIPTTTRRGSLLFAATVVEARGGRVTVPVMNVAGKRVKLPRQEQLGTWMPFDEDMQLLEISSELRRERVREWMESLRGGTDGAVPLPNESEINVGTDDDDERALILQLLRTYRTVLANEGDCPPACTTGVQHHIDTGGTAPLMLKRRRHAQSENAVIDENVAKMLAAGVIEESDGAWGFPVVLVRKKDGEVRFCIDYRALNKVTKRDGYPLPRIDETLESLHGARLFSTLDLRAGYWQIEVAPEDRDKTAFTTRQGLYRFRRMPFGLMNAPSTFQRMMNCVLRGLTWVSCLVYLDDIIVFTKGGIERHVIVLAVVFERLAAAGLSLKPKKCAFATTKLEYLGHELSPDGIRPLDRLVIAVREFPIPTDAVEVKRFVHLAGYYRRFVEGFGSMMAPMTRLLRKTTPWQWTEDQQMAFERVKRVLTEKPLLIYPDFSQPFTVVTDASVTGLGSCLMQDQGRGMQPVAFASKVNDPVVAKYAITELECLAVVWAIKLFRPYLYGRSFTIITDHAALKWLMTSPDLAGRLHRWALTLQEYDFDVQYRPGSTNVVADSLSRAPVSRITRAVTRARRAERVGPDRESSRMSCSGDEKIAMEADTLTGSSQNSTSTDEASTNGTAVVEAAGRGGKVATNSVEAQQQAEVFLAQHNYLAEDHAAKRTTSKALTTGGALRRSTRLHARAAARGRDDKQRDSDQPEGGESEVVLEQHGDMQDPHALREQEPPTQMVAPASSDTGSWDDAAAEGTAATARHQATTQARSPAAVGQRKTTRKGVTWNQSAGARRGAASSQPGDGSHADATPIAVDSTRRGGDTNHQVQRRTVRIEDEASAQPEPTLQLTDKMIESEQSKSKLVQKLRTAGQYRALPIVSEYGLVLVETARGRRVVLPPALWPIVFKEHHDSIWAGHLRGPQTYARIAQIYWWPNMQREVNQWVAGCQECGSRKARPREVIPPLRSLRGGAVGDRWALDVAGPLPTTDGGQRFVIVALEYVTRYAVARTCMRHTAEDVAEFLLEEVVLRFGSFRELLTDGASELTGQVIAQLVVLMQAEQINPVPYRPQMIGLVERFHRTWKDCVSLYVREDQRDWDQWVKFAVYAYNSARHSTVKLSPNELMMGRKLRAPNELLRREEVSEAGELLAYYKTQLHQLAVAHKIAQLAMEKEQARQAKYYNRRVRAAKEFKVGDRVWIFRPPTDQERRTKLNHQWLGPVVIRESVGYDNFRVEREDGSGGSEEFIVHCSFIVTYHYPRSLLERRADDVILELDDEEFYGVAGDALEAAEVAPAAVGAVHAASSRGRKRGPGPRGVNSTSVLAEWGGGMYEVRRRRRRNNIGQYVLEYQVVRTKDGASGNSQRRRRTIRDDDHDERWLSVAEYERLWRANRVGDDSRTGGGV
jgi:hypothetical protein